MNVLYENRQAERFLPWNHIRVRHMGIKEAGWADGWMEGLHGWMDVWANNCETMKTRITTSTRRMVK